MDGITSMNSNFTFWNLLKTLVSLAILEYVFGCGMKNEFIVFSHGQNQLCHFVILQKAMDKQRKFVIFKPVCQFSCFSVDPPYRFIRIKFVIHFMFFLIENWVSPCVVEP